ncbi:carboxypeptidase-like regulatory domain-containing protein [Winogradskyella sp.]|nr:carboxypeptidase-like regulatory domain-containing protein [Winogradskyella sp.]MDC0008925.1 carboxypeptidase-like regulatory domain-containing protein [Winogradskyella sp.]
MKTQLKLTQKKGFKTLSFVGIMMLTLFVFNSSYGQAQNQQEVTKEKFTVKGNVSSEDGPLPGANVILKGTKMGIVSDFNGDFTFPKSLKATDILVFTYLGYEKVEVVINKDRTFLKIKMVTAAVEIIGALDSAKPYKSKRKN